MKKKVIFSILLIIFSAFILLYKKNITDAAEQSPFTMYGFKISIIKYTGVGEPTRLGKPILVYPKGMMENAVEAHPASVPRNEEELFSGAYDLTQFVDYNAQDTIVESVDYEMCGEWGECDFGLQMEVENNHANRRFDTSAESYINKNNNDENITYFEAFFDGHDPEYYREYPDEFMEMIDHYQEASDGAFDAVVADGFFIDYGESLQNFSEVKEYIKEHPSAVNRLLDMMKLTPASDEVKYVVEMIDGSDNLHYEKKTHNANLPSNVVTADTMASYGSGICSHTEYIFRYNSGSKTVLYTKSMIKGLDEYYKTFEVKQLGTAEDVVLEYTSSSKKIKDNFGIDIESMDAKYIYIQVEVVQRVPDKSPNSQKVVSSYLVGKITEPDSKDHMYKSDGTGWDKLCINGYKSNGSGCSKKDIIAKTSSDGTPDNPCDKGYTFSKWNYNAMSEIVPNIPKYSGSCTKTETHDYWYKANCPEFVQFVRNIYGSVVHAASNIVVVRGYTGGNLIVNHANKASNSCSTNAHCILNGDQKCTNKYLYYVGPNEEEAMVGPTEKNPSITVKNGNYPYKLNDAKWKSGEYSCSRENGTPDYGIQHFYWININKCTGPNCEPEKSECQTLCSKLGANNTDEYLKCAEQYADGAVDKDLDRKRAVYNKKNWIIGQDKCNYTYGKDPTDGSTTSAKRESVNSCNNNKNMLYTTKTLDLTSNCNKIGETFVKDMKASKATGCYGDFVTDFNNDISDEKPNDPDMRSYINKVCVDTTNLEFKDISNLKLSKGSGFTYPVMQDGEKECKYFFNLEQWKVDYASIPAREVDNRKRMLYILDVFNGEVTNTYSKDNYISDFSGESYGKTKFEDEGFNFGDTQITTTIGESKATDDKTNSVQKTLEKDKAIIGIDNKTATRLQTIGTDTLTIVAYGSISTKPVNRYLSVGEGRETYSLENVCISSDGLATISKAPSNNVCYERKVSGKTQEVLAERKYYTSFNIGEGTNKIKTTVDIGKDGASYYKINETCKYGIGNCKGSCKLLVEPKDGKKIGDGQYESKELTVKLSHDIYYEVKNVKIIDNGTEHIGDSVNLTLGSGKSLNVHRLIGEVERTNGTKITCEEIIEQYNKSSCNASCSVEKINENVYKINTTNASKTYTFTSEHLRSTGTDKTSFLKEIKDSLSNQGKYVRLSSPLEEGERLFGYVEGSSCNNYCYFEQPTSTPSEANDCTKAFKPAETEDIHNYCVKNWKDDVNGYKDSDDCISKCTVMCPNNRRDLASLKEYCKNYSSIGFPDENHCLNSCYIDRTICVSEKKDPECPDCNPDPECPDCDPTPEDPTLPNYTFRSINVWNPFPNSSEDSSGDNGRTIGKNWQFFTDYITNDSDDKSSVTGENMNEKVEYVIDLSPTKVRQVRKDTKDNDLNISTSKRRVYGKLDRIKTTNQQIVEEYKSKFIHNSDFSGIFKQNHGSMSAVYPK